MASNEPGANELQASQSSFRTNAGFTHYRRDELEESEGERIVVCRSTASA